MTIGFVGLGNLGRAMARRLAEQSVELLVWNRTTEKATVFTDGIVTDIEAGKLPSSSRATAVDSPEEVLTRSNIIFLNLFDSHAVEQVLTGPNGLLAGNCRGRIIIDTTTNHFETVASFHQQVADAGAAYLEAPVLGSVVPASQGNLTMLVSGRREDYMAVRSYLEHLAKTIFFLERPTLATKMKLANNLVLGSLMATIAEALALGEAFDLPRDKVLEILGSGAGNSGVLNAKRQKLIDLNFSPHFSVAAIHKDLKYVAELAARFEQPLTMAQTAEELFRRSIVSGDGDADFSAVYQVMKQRR